MDIILKSATIVDPTSGHHLKKRDVLIKKGKIIKIAPKLGSVAICKEIKLKNLHISQGWFDSSVSFGEPGFEERENIANGLETAAYSGFAHVALNANTYPITDSKGDIQYLKMRAFGNAVNLYPIGALTVGSEQKVLSEMYDMKNEGALSFYDYKKPIVNANLLKLALQYSENFNGLVQSFPFEKAVAANGQVNEGENSTRLGLKGIPALSEELQIIRDLYILEYAGGKLHIPTISTKKSVSLIKEAKKKGLKVSCSVATANLFLTDAELETFDTNFKLLPPLRTKVDVDALRKGLVDGTIDGATSDHDPVDIEHKKTEFENAIFGSIGLESCYGALQTIFNLEETVHALTGLKAIFDIPSHPISEGSIANLSLFNPTVEWTFTEASIMSSSKNSAFLGQKFKGIPYGIYANNQLLIKNL